MLICAQKKYLYMKRYRPDYAIIIQYCWGKYYIARMCSSEQKAIAYTIRTYKTLSGASRYMELYNEPYGDNKDITPDEFWGTEKEVKEGKYWRAE